MACDGPAHLKELVSGRRRHEDSVTPGRASGVHVLLPLGAVFTVRITENTKAERSARREGTIIIIMMDSIHLHLSNRSKRSRF